MKDIKPEAEYERFREKYGDYKLFIPYWGL
jgi:hypothetical protein